MRLRATALGAALWTCAYTAVYVAVVHRQGDSPAWWYIAGLAVAVTLLVPAITGRPDRRLLTAAVVVLAGSAVIGLLSVGLLLVPAVGAAAVALATAPDAARPAPALDNDVRKGSPL